MSKAMQGGGVHFFDRKNFGTFTITQAKPMVVQTTSRGEPKVNTNIHFFKKSFKNEQTYFKFETF